jgi:hypothetical protein
VSPVRRDLLASFFFPAGRNHPEGLQVWQPIAGLTVESV